MSHPPMFGTFTVTVDGSNDLCRGPDTLQQRHDSRSPIQHAQHNFGQHPQVCITYLCGVPLLSCISRLWMVATTNSGQMNIYRVLTLLVITPL